jgi:hypothetical protein
MAQARLNKGASAIRIRGQWFVRVGISWRENRFGLHYPLYELASECPCCGRGFRVTATATAADRAQLARRCERCRNPGRVPKARRPRNLELPPPMFKGFALGLHRHHGVVELVKPATYSRGAKDWWFAVPHGASPPKARLLAVEALDYVAWTPVGELLR